MSHARIVSLVDDLDVQQPVQTTVNVHCDTCEQHIATLGTYPDEDIDGYMAAVLRACPIVNAHNGRVHPTVLAVRTPWYAA